MASEGVTDPRVKAVLDRFNDVVKTKLNRTDIVMSGDDSGSMAPGQGFSSRPADDRFASEGTWGEQAWLMDRVGLRAAEVDDDGVDINFINSKERLTLHRGESAATLMRNAGVRPTYTTEIWDVLEREFTLWLKARDAKPEATKEMIHMFFTDGAPGDGGTHSAAQCQCLVFNTIVWIVLELRARELNATHYSIQLLQVGRDEAAKKFLEACDDDLEKYVAENGEDIKKFLATKNSRAVAELLARHDGDLVAAYGGLDIVDTVKYTPGASAAAVEFEILKMLAGSKLKEFDADALGKVAKSLGVTV